MHSGSDSERVFTNTGEHILSVLVSGRVHDAAEAGGADQVEIIIQRNAFGGVGPIYSAPLDGESGVYNFADLGLRVTDRLKPGIAEIRWLADTWRNASPSTREGLTLLAQMPGAFENMLLQAASPETAQGLADLVIPVVDAGIEGFDELNADNVARGLYSVRTAGDLRTVFPLVLSAAVAIGPGLGRIRALRLGEGHISCATLKA